MISFGQYVPFMEGRKLYLGPYKDSGEGFPTKLLCVSLSFLIFGLKFPVSVSPFPNSHFTERSGVE